MNIRSGLLALITSALFLSPSQAQQDNQVTIPAPQSAPTQALPAQPSALLALPPLTLPPVAPSALPQPGEILFRGVVKSIDYAARRFTIEVAFFTLPNGRSARLFAGKRKQVFTDEAATFQNVLGEASSIASVSVGTPVLALGVHDGDGAPLWARLVTLGPWAPPAKYSLLRDPMASRAFSRKAFTGPAQAPYRSGVLAPMARTTYEDRGRYAAYVIRRFPRHRFTLSVSFDRGGHTARQAVNKPVSKMGRGAPQAIYAFGGGYFEPGSRRTIDYIVVGGREVDDYRWDWSRPVIAVKNGVVKIIRPQAHKDVSGKFDFALAADYKATRRAVVAGRQIFGLTQSEMFFVRCYSTEAAARRTIERLGVSDYVFLDGGSSTPPSARIPTRLLVVERPSVPSTRVANGTARR